MLKKAFKHFSPPSETRRWLNVQKICSQHGFELYKPHLLWLKEPEFVEICTYWNQFADNMPYDRRFFMFSTARTAKSVPGDTADVGVRLGTSSFFMLKGFNDPARPHHLFDSFEGLSEPSKEDATDADMQWKKGDLRVDERQTRSNLSIFPNCHFYKGWIPERFPEVEGRRFAFVHIDVDLYTPTVDSLEFFYPRMNKGGIMMFDDYGFASCIGARKAIDEFFADKPEAIFNIPTGQAIVIKS